MIYRGHDDIKRLLKTAMSERQMTVYKLAYQMGRDRSAFSRTLNNSRMTIEQLAEICGALGYDVIIELQGKE